MNQTWYLVSNGNRVSYPTQPFNICIGLENILFIRIKEAESIESIDDTSEYVVLNIQGKDQSGVQQLNNPIIVNIAMYDATNYGLIKLKYSNDISEVINQIIGNAIMYYPRLFRKIELIK